VSLSTIGLVAGIVGAIFWFFAYIFIIRRDNLDKSCGMPFAALCANISWEIIFSFVYPETACGTADPLKALTYSPLSRGISPGALGQEIVNIIWFVLDVFIVITYLRFGRRDFTPLVPQRLFIPSFVAVFAMSMIIVGTSVVALNDCIGLYSAFGMNLLMSVLFPIVLLQRASVRSQSFYIALFKMLGTLGFSLHFFSLNPNDAFMNSQYILIFLFDLLYTVMIYQACKREGINPLTRF
jgi:hypothetical protein